MKIKESNNRGFYFQIINKLKKGKLLFVLSLVFVYSALMILLGGVAHKEGVFGEVLIPAMRENVKIPFNYLEGVFYDSEKLIIDIKHKDYQKLAFKRKNALREGVLHPLPDDYVNAKIRWNGRSTKVELRLKGDLADHWARDYKWSLRVKTKGDGTVLGMKNFSLQHPATRGFLNDWVLHKILKKEDLVALRYDFVDVVVNGKQLGIYALEEHFEQKLLENNRRIDGPIIRLKDHLLWYLVDPKSSSTADQSFSVDQVDELYTVSPIDAFTSTRINNDKDLLKSFNIAKNLLEAFRRGKLKTSEVFDTDKLAKVFAVIDLFGYRHTTAYSNIRFYYNPFTSRLEPVGYDNTFIYNINRMEGQGKQIKTSLTDDNKRLDWKDTFFEDRVFFEKYMLAVRDVSEKKFLDDLFDEIDDELNSKLKIIYKSFPAYSFEAEKDILYKNQKSINKRLNPLEGMQAYIKKLDRKNNEIILEVGNNQLLPIIIKNISINGVIYSLSEHAEYLLQAKTPHRPIDFSEVKVSLPDNISWLDGVSNIIKVNYSLLGSPVIKEIKAFPWSYLDAGFLENDVIRKKANYDEFDFIKTSESEKEIYIRKGKWKINKNLIVPEGYTLIAGPNTELDVVESSFIISSSPVRFKGSKTGPITIKSSDQTGQGVLILNANEKSVINNVVFKNLSSPEQVGLNVKGALTLYESDVEASNMRFKGNKSDVDLYIVRSHFNVDESEFDQSKEVALNVIFSEGKISNSTFTNSGRTALDVTGSNVDAENIKIADAKINGMNVKDRSKVKINNLSVSGVKNALISQSSSAVDVKDLIVENCINAFSALQAKSDYGPSIISVTRFDDSQVNGSYLIEEKSTLLLNEKEYEVHTKNIFEKLKAH